MATNNDIRIPAASIHALRASLFRELGPEQAGRALQEAGYAAGNSLFDRLNRRLGESQVAATPSASFWDRMSGLFREMGWGVVRHEGLHPGVGAIIASEWFEVDRDTGRSSCPFTTGVLANLLGRVAEGEVAVMQAPGSESEPGTVRFLFGSADALDGLYAGLREGRDLDAALASLA